MRAHFRTVTSVALLILLVIGGWMLVSLGLDGVMTFPGPNQTLVRFSEMVVDGYRGSLLHEHLWSSLSKVLLAVGLSVLSGVPLALLMTVSPWFYGFFAPVIYFSRALPPLGYYSLLIVLLGIGDVSKIFLLYLAAFPPIVISTYRTLVSLPVGLVETARLLGSSGPHLLLHFLIPAISGGLFSGIRIAMGFALTTIVAAEIVAADSGIGWVILDASRYLQFDVVLVGVISIGTSALVLDGLLGAIEDRLKGKRRRGRTNIQ